jgi:hypothetical protein
MRTPLLILSFEALVLMANWVITRLRGQRPMKRDLRCPLDGRVARLELVDVVGRVEPVNLVRCSLLATGAVRSCDRSCLRSVSSGPEARD